LELYIMTLWQILKRMVLHNMSCLQQRRVLVYKFTNCLLKDNLNNFHSQTSVNQPSRLGRGWFYKSMLFIFIIKLQSTLYWLCFIQIPSISIFRKPNQNNGSRRTHVFTLDNVIEKGHNPIIIACLWEILGCVKLLC
jgi:hypothetical protein